MQPGIRELTPPARRRTAAFLQSTGDPVSVMNPGTQSNTEGDSVSLPIYESDWSTGSGSASGSGSGVWSASGLPAGLTISSINSANGLITGTIQAGDAANGPYYVTASYTDGAGNSASQTFEWDVSDPVTMIAPGDQSGAEGDVVALQIQAGDSITGAVLSYSETGLPPGLAINAQTGQITGTIDAGGAVNSSYVATITAADGTYSVSQTFSWAVTANTPAPANNPLDAVFASVAATATNSLAAFMLLQQPQEQPSKAKNPFDLVAPADAPLTTDFMDEEYYSVYLQYAKVVEGFKPDQVLTDQQKRMKTSVEAVQELIKLRDMKSDYLEVNVDHVNVGVVNFTAKASRDPGSVNLYMGHGQGDDPKATDPDTVRICSRSGVSPQKTTQKQGDFQTSGTDSKLPENRLQGPASERKRQNQGIGTAAVCIRLLLRRDLQRTHPRQERLPRGENDRHDNRGCLQGVRLSGAPT